MFRKTLPLVALVIALSSLSSCGKVTVKNQIQSGKPQLQLNK